MDFTLSQAAEQFGVGATAQLYKQSGPVLSPPPGNPIQSAVVQPSGSLTFTDLQPDADYVAKSGSRYITFHTASIPRRNYGHEVEDEDNLVADRDALAFKGSTVTVTDDPTNNRTVVTIEGFWVNVNDHGAIGGTDPDPDVMATNHDAFMAALALIEANGGGTLVTPDPWYVVRPTAVPGAFPADYAADLDWHAIGHDFDNLTVRGNPIGGTVIECYAYDGQRNEDSWQIAGGQVWRGAGWFVGGGDSAGVPRKSTAFIDITLDGTSGNTNNNTWPANAGTGDGWDITHKGIWLENDKHFDGIHFGGVVEVRAFRGELIYSGGPNVKNVTGQRIVLHDTNSSAWSVDANISVDDIKAYNTANHGVEDFQSANGPSTYGKVEVYDCALTGLNIVGTDARPEPIGPTRIRSLLARRCLRNALLFNGVRHVTIDDVLAIDCSPANPNRVIQIDTSSQGSAYKIRDLKMKKVSIVADQSSVYDGLALVDSAGVGMEDVRIDDYECVLTDQAAAAGRTFHSPVTATTALLAQVKINGVRAKGTTFGRTDLGVANDVLLTTTGLTTLVERRPNKQRNFLVCIYYRVVTGASDVLINMEHTDGTGATVYTTLQASVSKAIGSYMIAPVFVNARGNNDAEKIKLILQASVANRVYVSASIVELPD